MPKMPAFVIVAEKCVRPVDGSKHFGCCFVVALQRNCMIAVPVVVLRWT